VGNRPPLAPRSSLKLVVSGPEPGKSPTNPLVISSIEVREDIMVSPGQRCLEVSRGRAEFSTVCSPCEIWPLLLYRFATGTNFSFVGALRIIAAVYIRLRWACCKAEFKADMRN